MPFGLGIPEVVIVGLVALIIFGPKKLPEMGSSLGKAIRGFKSGISEDAAPSEKTPESPDEKSQPQNVASRTGQEN